MPDHRPFRLAELSAPSETLDEVARRLAEHATAKGPTRLVVPVNGQVFVLAAKNAALASVLRSAEDLLLDGISVYLGSRWLGNRRARRVPGVDLMVALHRAAAPGTRVLLLGGLPGSAENVRDRLRVSSGGLVVGTVCPPMGFERSPKQLDELLGTVDAFQPDLLFVALGAPRQEVFMDRHLRQRNIPVVMAVGGSFEMVGGTVARAPRWMQAIGMEWFFRMVTEPRRLLWRYVSTNTVFVWLLLRELVAARAKPRAGAERADAPPHQDAAEMKLG